MSLSPNEKYPGATEADPNYKDSKFKDNNPSTANNGSPLKALDRNEQLALQEAMMNAAGFDYNGVVDTPQNSQMFSAYKAALSNGANLLSNHNFIIASPDDSQPAPSATPTSYPPGFQIFSGVFANETTGILNLTYIDGRVSFSGGDFYMSVPNTGALENITEFVASVADFDGKPRTRGVSYALVGDEHRITVGIDALEDVAANPTPLGSVKFEQGSVATGHEAGGVPVKVKSVDEMKSLSLPEGFEIKTSSYRLGSNKGGMPYIAMTGVTADEMVTHTLANGLVAVPNISNAINIMQCGAYLNGTANDTPYYNAAIDWCYNNNITWLYTPKTSSGTRIDPSDLPATVTDQSDPRYWGCIVCKSGVNLQFATGMKIHGDSTMNAGLSRYAPENRNRGLFTFDGNRVDGSAETSRLDIFGFDAQGGYIVALLGNVSSINIYKFKATGQQLDGITVGLPGESLTVHPRDCMIYKFKFDGQDRDNISVVAGKNIEIRSGKTLNAVGTDWGALGGKGPGAGINVEPEVGQICEDIKFNNVTASGGLIDFQVFSFYNRLPTSQNARGVSFTNCDSNGGRERDCNFEYPEGLFLDNLQINSQNASVYKGLRIWRGLNVEIGYARIQNGGFELAMQNSTVTTIDCDAGTSGLDGKFNGQKNGTDDFINYNNTVGKINMQKGDLIFEYLSNCTVKGAVCDSKGVAGGSITTFAQNSKVEGRSISSFTYGVKVDRIFSTDPLISFPSFGNEINITTLNSQEHALWLKQNPNGEVKVKATGAWSNGLASSDDQSAHYLEESGDCTIQVSYRAGDSSNKPVNGVYCPNAVNNARVTLAFPRVEDGSFSGQNYKLLWDAPTCQAIGAQPIGSI